MSTKKETPKNFRETSWFAEGARKSELHREAQVTGEELPEDHRTLEEKYQAEAGSATPAPEEAALSLRTGTTGARPAVTEMKGGRDTARALRAVVRTPMATFFRGLGFTLLGLVILAGALLAGFWFSPGFNALVRTLLR